MLVSSRLWPFNNIDCCDNFSISIDAIWSTIISKYYIDADDEPQLKCKFAIFVANVSMPSSVKHRPKHETYKNTWRLRSNSLCVYYSLFEIALIVQINWFRFVLCRSQRDGKFMEILFVSCIWPHLFLLSCSTDFRAFYETKTNKNYEYNFPWIRQSSLLSVE